MPFIRIMQLAFAWVDGKRFRCPATFDGWRIYFALTDRECQMFVSCLAVLYTERNQ